IIFGGRIPNYHEYSDKFGPKEYIQKVKLKEIYDPVLSFQLTNDFHVKKVLKNYLPGDQESQEYATLLQWDNVYYQPETTINKKARLNIRIGLIQWKMRALNTMDELFKQSEH